MIIVRTRHNSQVNMRNQLCNDGLVLRKPSKPAIGLDNGMGLFLRTREKLVRGFLEGQIEFLFCKFGTLDP